MYPALLGHGQGVFANTEKIVIKVNLLQHHFGMENVVLVHIDINHLVLLTGITREKILYRVNTVIDEMFLAAHIPGEAAYAVVKDNNIRLKTMDQVV